jgi:uroporphyrinogen decarboxylase
VRRGLADEPEPEPEPEEALLPPAPVPIQETSMNSKERVIRALTRTGLPDRVPVQFDLSRDLADRLAAQYGIPAHYTTAYYEDVTYRLSNNDLRVAMGSDCVIVGAGLPAGYQHPRDRDGAIINEFGMKMRQGPTYMDVIVHPLADAQTTTQVADFAFPDPLAEGRYDDAAHFIAKYRGTYFVWATWN